jgi:exopolyphosphatase/guanosine-5'-triphosphate,3'-diphosphate pyrophosphatase
MRVGIIDLGTNSVRFDVHSLAGKGRLLHREKLMIRLGQGVFLKGKMDAQAIERAVHALAHFRRVADSLRVRRIVAFGTSALREAQDSNDLLERVKEETGIEIKIISGREEANLIALGVLAHQKTPNGKFALVDIGGGSTEISLCKGKKVLEGESFPLGTARLQQVFLKRSPPKPQAVEQLREYIRDQLNQKNWWQKIDYVVGSSGTVKAVAKILNKKSFSLKDVSSLVKKMQEMDTSQLLDLPTLEAKRVDMILAGAILLEEVLKRLKAKSLVPTDYSLRDGILEEERRLTKAHKSSLIELHLEDLLKRSDRYGQDPDHQREIVELTGEIFDRLKSLHRLEAKWKVYLQSAIILRKAGEIVSFANREKHAYYIVKNSDFPSMEAWEQEFIAQLVLHQHGGKIENFRELKGRKPIFEKLVALLRVIDAIDLGSKSHLTIKRVRITRSEVTVSFRGEGSAGIEQLLLERKKKLFEEVFQRTLRVERWKKG